MISALYAVYIPVLQQHGLIGIIAFALVIMAAFAGFGYLYDIKLRLWESDALIANNRNPFAKDLLSEKELTYLARDITMMRKDLLFFYFHLGNFKKEGLDTGAFERLLKEEKEWIERMEHWLRQGYITSGKDYS